ncbi:acetyltransferase [Aeromicrobium sp.]|uniref:acetyltransferase n=1 Tax=Aeromicrobium sp. TaxID=1871063 RepID=UPI003D6B5869
MTALIIVGAGGFGRQMLSYALELGLDVAGFVDDDLHALDGTETELPILGTTETMASRSDHEFVVAVGDPASRQRLAQAGTKAGGRLRTLIHASAFVDRTATIGPGCIISPFAMVGAGAQVGENSVINVHAAAAHDTIVGTDCVLSPYVALNGGVSLGDGVFVGTHAAVLPGVRVGACSKISAGSIVYSDVEPGSLVAGNPAQGRVMFRTDS